MTPYDYEDLAPLARGRRLSYVLPPRPERDYWLIDGVRYATTEAARTALTRPVQLSLWSEEKKAA